MTRVLTALAMSTFLSVLATTSSAQDDQGQMVHGMGALGCDVLVDTLQGDQASEAATRLMAWLSGYVSHANRATTGTFDVVPYTTMEEFATVVARLCASNPQAQVEAATGAALRMLTPLAVDGPSDAVELESGDNRLIMRTSVLQAIQQRLIARDLLPDSSADGIFGAQTAEALAAFQEQAGLQVTGMPDAWTVFVLTAMDGQP